MNRDDLRHLLLSGTVTFPATFPQLGNISLVNESIPGGAEGDQQREMLVVKEFPSAKVTISRRVFADKVRAVFVPHDVSRVSYACGTWLLDQEVAVYLRDKRQVLGIVFVSETESTLLDVRAGMTAGESAQYYPPLPADRSFNHYGGPQKQRPVFSCNVTDDPGTESVVSRSIHPHALALQAMGAEFMFSCDGPDDVGLEVLSCDSPDGTFDS